MSIKQDKRTAPPMLAWLFALIGILATGVNLQAGALDTGKNFNPTDAAQFFVFSNNTTAALLSERDDNHHGLDTSTANIFTTSKINWRFVGILASFRNGTPPLSAVFHLRPPLRAPPFK
jgi:hypothetical protein